MLKLPGLIDPHVHFRDPGAVHNPRRIFGLPEQPETWIVVDPDAEWRAHGPELQTRAKWTPFEGWTLRGRVRRVVLRGREAYGDGEIIAQPGEGKDIRQA